ncbi:MAG: outer membrane beta-barrel domain-containing protein [Myxococcaceae bacterium]
MKRLLLALVFAVVALPATSFAQTEEDAGDVSEVDKDRVGPLRERVRPVSGHLFRKRGRFEFSPSVTASLNDAFFSKYLFGAKLGFFPSEEFGLHLRGGYALTGISGAAQICTTEADAATTRGCRAPSYAEVDGRAPGQITFLGGIDAEYSPIYGKVALVAETFLHFDLYALAGASLVGYQGPSSAVSGSTPMMTVGGNVGVGTRIFLNKWATIRAELRDLIYVEQIQPIPATSLRNQLMFELGFSMFLPTSFLPE